MSVSHDGDRVSRETARKTWRKVSRNSEDRQLADWGSQSASKRRDGLARFSGDYGCSLPEIDRIVDFARGQPGVEGAQLAGAGLGGCVMALVRQSHTAGLLQALAEQGISGEVFRPIAGACSLMMD
jgi:galactokinase/mevalonate kinase-like predicted kinase